MVSYVPPPFLLLSKRKFEGHGLAQPATTGSGTGEHTATERNPALLLILISCPNMAKGLRLSVCFYGLHRTTGFVCCVEKRHGQEL